MTATPGGGGRIAIKTNGNLTLGTIKLDGHRPGTLHISGSTPTAALSHSSGTLTIDTTYGYWTHSGGTHGVGVIENKDDDGIEYKTCTFSFPSINLATGLTVNLQGENSLILKTTNNGDISIGTSLSANGGNAEIAYPGFYSTIINYGMGKLGGHNGGTKNSDNGYGPGGGKMNVNGTVGGGGGYGSKGQYQSTDTSFGNTYGSPYIAHLHGGSGGGSGAGAGGGAGGGAISLEADGNGTLTITSGGTLSANGGTVSGTASNGGGGGSGGSIRLSGKTITNNGSIQAKGATPPAGGIGGGGRVVFAYTTNLTEGSVDVGTGAQQGTVTENTPPTISSGSTATATFSNLNYRKNSATRFNDIAFWYSFDEASGATATDFSNNGRDATLKNMTAANRVGGKIGKALSFDSPSSKTCGDGSGQHLDLGNWSFGGAFTLSAWIKADEWRNSANILSLSGTEGIGLRYTSSDGGALVLDVQASSGAKYSNSGDSLIQWGQWMHLSVVQEDGGAGTSNVKFYRNGTLFTSFTDKTAPSNANRTPQYIGRSGGNNTARYFAGDLDEFRLYKVALSADDASAVYAETNGTTWYTVTSNSGTDYSATGLPSGLAINPTTGEISGHPTEIGDHNVTVTASNLAGSDSKVVTITVNPTAPLLQSGLYQPTGMSLWLDAAELTAAGSTWTDKSGNGNDATKNGSPSVLTEEQNGLSVMRYSGTNGQYHAFPAMTDIRTVFWVVWKWGTDDNRFMLGYSPDQIYDFHSHGNYYFASFAAAKNGQLKVNGSSINGESTTQPSTLSVVSLRSTSDLRANNFSNDRNIGGRTWKGDLGELLIFNSTLSFSDIEKIEGYLAHKWGLTGSLASGHPYKSTTINQPVVSVDSVGSTSGTASVTILETGGADVSIDYYYGTTDKGETTTGWDYSGSLSGAQSAGSATIALNGLTAGTSYIFRIKASNSAGAVWTNATSFTTNSQTQPPSIATETPDPVGGDTATVKGNLLAKDGDTVVTLYYGTTDQGETDAGWDASASISSGANLNTGSFSHSLTGLTAGTRYLFRYKAVTTVSAVAYTSYSNLGEFVTLGLPQVLVPGATDVTKTSVTLNADLNSTGGVSYTTGGPFSSSTVPGLLMWLDGNDPDADGTANTTQYDLVNNTGWKDKSGNNRDANRVTSAPTFMPNTLGGKGVVDFDGAWRWGCRLHG